MMRKLNLVFLFVHSLVFAAAIVFPVWSVEPPISVPKVGPMVPLALPLVSAALAFMSIFSFSVIRAVSDKERQYEQSAFEYSLKLTDAVQSDSFSDEYKGWVRARVKNMLSSMEHPSRVLRMTRRIAKGFTKISLIDLTLAFVFALLSLLQTGQVQAVLFWLSLALSLIVTGVLTAGLAFKYY